MENKRIGKVLLDLNWYDIQDVYSDGDIEDEMLTLARQNTPAQINAILNKTRSWPIFYHFSPMRENILAWYPFHEQSSVLEVGAGCGAITGVLCRKCAIVTANDLSLRRCEINAWRHQEYDNLKIVVSNFQQLAEKGREKYDYITLIGVFEYAASYIHSNHPYEDFLEMVNEMLAPGGKILLAIENRFGAKYFAGCTEDHLGTFFSGIAGYPPESPVKTMNYQEWKSFLETQGYNNVRFFYPYPDYKFPRTIYSDERLPEAGELHYNLNNMDNDRFVLFPEDRFWDSIVGTAYFRDFSNSFLIEIGQKGE